MATLLQQWARRYLQLTRPNHLRPVRAHIREYYARGADMFQISTLVEAMTALLLISVLLFFSGLVVFAFRDNNTVAYITLSIVSICTLLYIALTFAPLIFHHCPYQTPLSSLLWSFAQVIPLFILSVAHTGAKFFCYRLGVVNTEVVERFRNRQINKKNTFSQGMSSTFEGSAKRFSLDIYRSALCRMLNLLHEDHELEEFVAGIPGLSESDALHTFDGHSPDDRAREVLAALPGPTTFHDQLSWSIVQLSQRAITSGVSESVRRRRTEVCLKALYHIPGAIRDILAAYAAGAHHCLQILPLLNSTESLKLIKELWDTADKDIALSVRCVAATISAFIITPPEGVHDKYLPPGVRFIGGKKEPGPYFLSKRLHMDKNREDDDSARLQNIVLFLKDIREIVESMDKDLWMRLGPGGSLLNDVKAERDTLHEARHEAEYCTGSFKSHGNRTSLEFGIAVQHDLLALTLEILARESVTGAAQVQRYAFRDAFSELESLVKTARGELGIAETADIVVGGLRPVVQQLGLLASIPESEPSNQLPLAPSETASFYTARRSDVEAEREPRVGDNEVTPDRPDQLPLASSDTASFCTAQGEGVEAEQEPCASDDDVTPDQLPLAFSGAVFSFAMEGVTMATRMVVDAFSPVVERLGLFALTPDFEPGPPNQSPLASSGTASFCTAQGVGVEAEQDLLAGVDEVAHDQSPLAPSGAVSLLEMEGGSHVTTAADSTSALPIGTTTSASPTSPSESSYPSHSTTSSKSAGIDPATLV